MAKTYGMRLVESERGRPLEQLIASGVDRGLNIEQLAAEFGVSRSTLLYWCWKLGLKIVSRPVLERTDEMAGAGR